MRTETRVIYTAEELKKERPESFEKALKAYQEKRANDVPFWNDDACASGRAVVERAGLRLDDWCIDQCSAQSTFYKVTGFGEDGSGKDIGEYTGRKAREWINAAFSGRNKYGKEFRINWRTKREPGECWFTGYCADDEVIDVLKADIKSGDTLKQTFENIAQTIRKTLERESEYEQTEEYFLDHAGANGYEYDENGDRV